MDAPPGKGRARKNGAAAARWAAASSRVPLPRSVAAVVVGIAFLAVFGYRAAAVKAVRA